jgi:hypothetical protein
VDRWRPKRVVASLRAAHCYSSLAVVTVADVSTFVFNFFEELKRLALRRSRRFVVCLTEEKAKGNTLEPARTRQIHRRICTEVAPLNGIVNTVAALY